MNDPAPLRLGRRRALRALAGGACLLIVRPARATPEELARVLRDLFGERSITPGRVKLEVPRLAENGNDADEVYRLSISFFPLTQVKDKP